MCVYLCHTCVTSCKVTLALHRDALNGWTTEAEISKGANLRPPRAPAIPDSSSHCQAQSPLTLRNLGSGKEDAKEGPLVPPSPSQGYNCTENVGSGGGPTLERAGLQAAQTPRILPTHTHTQKPSYSKCPGGDVAANCVLAKISRLRKPRLPGFPAPSLRSPPIVPNQYAGLHPSTGWRGGKTSRSLGTSNKCDERRRPGHTHMHTHTSSLGVPSLGSSCTPHVYTLIQIDKGSYP